MKLEIPIGKFAKYIEEFNASKLVSDVEVNVTDFGITVPGPGTVSNVDWFVKKDNLPMVGVEFDNGYCMRVAKQHIFQSSGSDVFAGQLVVGSQIDHVDGSVTVNKLVDVPNETCFDIAIDNPHLYYDANGVLHHNTIVTAALSWNVQTYGRSIIIVPNKSLVTQTEKDYINLGLDVGVYFGDRKDHNKTHTICTWQSLNVLMKNTADGSAEYTINDFIEGVACVIVDECFDGNARVLTPAGYVPIVDIAPGDIVINYCEKTKEFKADTVTKQHTNLTNSLSETMYELEFDNAAKIQVTGNHKFLTSLGWCRADELTIHHEIVTTT